MRLGLRCVTMRCFGQFCIESLCFALLFPQLRLALGVPTSSVQRNAGLEHPVPRPRFLELALPFAFRLPLGKLGARVPLWLLPLPLGMLGARVPTRHRQSSGSSFALSLLLACLWHAFSMPLACL